ncbi:MAG TPA: branched-chain amino acid ABC transporter permease [Polyangiales bacterium]|nr:branched-chain amino acid ABC transporter permease [Polyangiales bacterium]
MPGRQTKLASGAGWIVLALLALALPALTSHYGLSVAIAMLYLAFTGQAWNVMMGFAGQLSLGHALYVGLGAYVSGALFAHHGVAPWLGMWAGMAAAVASGALIGWLAFRFRVAGVYFAVLTIASAEFTRIGFDHFEWTGGPAGLFLKVAQRDTIDLLNLRGPPAMYYYAMLALALGALWLCARLLRSRIGYYWLAIREDEHAAAALGIPTLRFKLFAVLISAALTSIAGVFMAFYKNSLFPEQVFDMSRSIEIMLAPIIGGLGTLLGPILGAFVLTLLGEGTNELLKLAGLELPGMKQVVYGVLLLFTVWFLPNGLWPPLQRMLAKRASD